MKKILVLTLFVYMAISVAGVSRSIYVSLQDASGTPYAFPDPSVTFKCWIQERPTELLQELSPSSDQGMVAGYSYVITNIGNFPTAWAAGETVVVRPRDESMMPNGWYESVTGDVSYILDEDASAIYLGFEPVMAGTGLPLVMGAYRDGIELNMPKETNLEQNYPNPFNPTTTINFSIAEAGNVQLNVYNFSGQLVSSIVDEQMNAGSHTVNFDASNLSAGVYYYTLEANNMTMTNKMILVK